MMTMKLALGSWGGKIVAVCMGCPHSKWVGERFDETERKIAGDTDRYMRHWRCLGRNRGREAEPCGEQYLSLL